jgi:hypothetical protein
MVGFRLLLARGIFGHGGEHESKVATVLHKTLYSLVVDKVAVGPLTAAAVKPSAKLGLRGNGSTGIMSFGALDPFKAALRAAECLTKDGLIDVATTPTNVVPARALIAELAFRLAPAVAMLRNLDVSAAMGVVDILTVFTVLAG